LSRQLFVLILFLSSLIIVGSPDGNASAAADPPLPADVTRGAPAEITDSLGKPEEGPTVSPHTVDPATLPAASGVTSSRPTRSFAGTTDPSLAEKIPTPVSLPPPPAAKTTAAPTLFFQNDAAGLDNSIFAGSPPDPGGIAGLTQYVQTVNESFAVYDKSAPTPRRLRTTSLQSFFGTMVFDPHVTLDYSSHRFAIVADDGKNVHLAISSTTDALGGWCLYTLGGLNSDNSPGGFADYPLVSFGGPRSYLYISLDEFTSPDASGRFIGNRMIILSADDLRSCVSAKTFFYQNLTHPGTTERMSIITPTTNNIPNPHGPDTGFWIAPHTGGGTDISYLTFDESTRTLTSYKLPSQAYAPPPPARQMGSSVTVETLDNRIYQSTFFRQSCGACQFPDYIVFSMPTACTFPGSATAVSCIGWYVINPFIEATPRILFQSLFGYDSTFWVFFPSVAMDTDGLLVFNYTTSGTNFLPSATSVVLNFALGTFSGNYIQGFGTHPYADGNQPARWGDFSAIFLDPAGQNPGKTFWMDSETTIANNKWGTHISAAQSICC
jgi:hypothetical protein